MIEYGELKIETAEDVYAPSDDSFLAAKFIGDYLGSLSFGGMQILDMGTGTGILGLVAAKDKKVTQVVFVDINKSAVALASKNADANKYYLNAKCTFIEGDLLNNVAGMFDLMIFNPPYLRHLDKNEKMKEALDGGRQGVETTIAFLRSALPHLNNFGAIILVSSSFSNTKMLEAAENRLGLKRLKSEKMHLFFEDIVVTLLSR